MCHSSDVPGQRPGDEVVEAVAELRDDASADLLTGWCAERGIRVLPMAAGVLLTAEWQRLLDAFGARASDWSRPQTLPVPPELRTVVRSVTVVAPPSPHSPGH
ncbi:hypothetical protein [Streptomyces acidicola]|uniref:hypothetical protein n=1 Tax=Streptomyces acidicola TaxID=2596892 RepID=UPI003413FA3F